MRKWQQDITPETELQGAETEIPTQAPSVKIEKHCEAPKPDLAFQLTKYHYAALVFIVSLALLCILKPFFVQTTQKDRSYESPNLSFVTAFILSALVALGYLLVCD